MAFSPVSASYLVVWEVGDGIHPLWSIGVARMGPLYAGVAFDPVGSRLAASRIRPGPAVHDYGGPVEPAVEVYRIVGRSAAELPAGLVTEVPVRHRRAALGTTGSASSRAA